MKMPSHRGILLVAAAVLALTLMAGCKSASGSREFLPGKGWRST